MKKIMVICLIILVAFPSCSRSRHGKVKNVHMEQQNFDQFNGIKVSGFLKAKVVKGDQYEVKLTLPENYVDKYSLEIDADSNLFIRFDQEKNNSRTKNRHLPQVEIMCPSFSKIIAGDGGSVEVVSEFSFEHLELIANDLSSISFIEGVGVHENCKIEANNLSNIKLFVKTENLAIKSSDLSSVTVTGSTSGFRAEANDLAKIKCRKLHTKIADMTARSLSEIAVCADEKLEMEAYDLSKISYSGKGEVVKKYSQSMSRIVKR